MNVPKEKEVVSGSLDFNCARWTLSPAPGPILAAAWIMVESPLEELPLVNGSYYLWAWLRSAPRSWVKRWSGQDSELQFGPMRETGGNLGSAQWFPGQRSWEFKGFSLHIKVSYCALPRLSQWLIVISDRKLKNGLALRTATSPGAGMHIASKTPIGLCCSNYHNFNTDKTHLFSLD